MRFPLRLETYTIRDADDRVVICSRSPCDQKEKEFIVKAVNDYAARHHLVKVEDKEGGKQ